MKFTIIALVLAILIIGGCAVNIPTITLDNFKPGGSCSSYNKCYNFLNQYGMGGQAPVTVNVQGWNNNYVNYESLDGSVYSSFNLAVADSEASDGIRTVTVYVPSCNPTMTHLVGNNLIPYYGYIIVGRTSQPTGGFFQLEGLTFGNDWTYVNGDGINFIPLPIDNNTLATMTFDPATSTNGGIKLWCV